MVTMNSECGLDGLDGLIVFFFLLIPKFKKKKKTKKRKGKWHRFNDINCSP